MPVFLSRPPSLSRCPAVIASAGGALYGFWGQGPLLVTVLQRARGHRSYAAAL